MVRQTKKFTRTKEDFICDNCGYKVTGTGYTNHCPKCLYSKHVDINPGDRQARCGGLMKPVGVEQKKQLYRIVHQCDKCDQKRKSRVVKEDNFNVVLNCVNKL
ncbi:MAG: RNHCP domain-containing protein [Patescibacteria group bacterium]